MIVNQLQEGWEVLFHRSHALLASQLARHWHFEGEPPWLWETLVATMQHDDHVIELDKLPLTNMGHPQDFRLSREFDPESNRHHVETAQHRSRWIGLLTSMHLCLILAEEAEDNEKARSFISDQKVLQEKLLCELPFNRKDAEDAYFLLRFCDRLSLILSCREIPEKERQLEICSNGELTYFLKETGVSSITVKPWPFAPDQFSVQVETRLLEKSSFGSSKDFERELRDAQVRLRTWKLSQKEAE